MTDDTAQSFTATLLVNGHALRLMADAVDRSVAVAHPDPLLGTLDITHALVALSGPDAAWDEARDAGRVDFHLTDDLSPTLFYFRHTGQGYRLYLRGGCCEGQGVFNTRYGIPMAQPIDGSDPSAWQLRHAHSQQPVVLSELATDFAMITLDDAVTGARLTGKPVGLDEGLYLATSPSAPATALRLNIQARGVDWAGP